jgi:hypothetical protein
LIDRIKKVQGVAATMVAWWNLGLPRLVFSDELKAIHVAAAPSGCGAAPGSSLLQG